MAETLIRKSLARLQNQFESAAEKHPGIGVRMVHVDAGEPKRPQELMDELPFLYQPPEGELISGGVYGRTVPRDPKKCSWRVYWLSRKPDEATARFVDLARRTVDHLTLFLALPEIPAGLRRESIESQCRDSTLAWISCLFDLAWQRRAGLKADKSICLPDGGYLIPYSRRQWALHLQMWPTNTTLPKWIESPPGYFFSELDDVFLTSVQVIDVLLDEIGGIDQLDTADAGSDRQDQQPEATGESGGQDQGTEAGDDDLERICEPLTALQIRIIECLWKRKGSVTFARLRSEAWKEDSEIQDRNIARRLKDIETRWAKAEILDVDLEISVAKGRVKLIKPKAQKR